MDKLSACIKALKGLIFFACLSFVLWQCYLSFTRFLEEPISTSVGSDSAKNWPMPKITICPATNLKFDYMETCNILNWEDGQWVGKDGPGDLRGSPLGRSQLADQCLDPKWVIENTLDEPKKFIKEVNISTFQGEHVHLDWTNGLSNSSLNVVDFVYDSVNFEEFYPLITSCYELIVPQRLLSDGIQNIVVVLNGIYGVSSVVLNSPGYLYQNSNNKRRILNLDGNEPNLPSGMSFGLSFELVHQIDNFLKIGDEQCNEDPSYNRDECVIEQLLQIWMERYGCIPPSLGNYDFKVCTNGNSSMMREVNKLIDCQKPCKMFKMHAFNEKLTEWLEGLDLSTLDEIWMKVSVSFEEVITITNDQYSYIWLNLVAEAGGYVGLFLGYSVFQASDLLDILIRKIHGMF